MNMDILVDFLRVVGLTAFILFIIFLGLGSMWLSDQEDKDKEADREDEDKQSTEAEGED